MSVSDMFSSVPDMVASRSAQHLTCMLEGDDKPQDPTSLDLARSADSLVGERLFAARTVLIFGEIHDRLARVVTAQLLALAADSARPIRIVINSPGGHVESGDTIHDVIRSIDAPVTMLGTGWVASAGALIFVAAEKERRFALPNTRFLLHQPLGGAQGPATDIEIEVSQIVGIRERLHRTFARATGQPLDKVSRDMERNFWMNAEEARAYGLVNRVIERMSDA